MQNVRFLQPAGYTTRVDFCHWLLRNLQLQAKTLFTHKITFNRDGRTDARNSHVWLLDNPHASTKTHFQSRLSVNIWSCVIGNQVIGQSVLEGRLTSERCFRFLQELWLQKHGAPPNLDRQYFQNRWIGRKGPVAWPPRSPDFTLLDYNLWGRVKSPWCMQLSPAQWPSCCIS